MILKQMELCTKQGILEMGFSPWLPIALILSRCPHHKGSFMSSLALQFFIYHSAVYLLALSCVPSHGNKYAGLFEMERK